MHILYRKTFALWSHSWVTKSNCQTPSISALLFCGMISLQRGELLKRLRRRLQDYNIGASGSLAAHFQDKFQSGDHFAVRDNLRYCTTYGSNNYVPAIRIRVFHCKKKQNKIKGEWTFEKQTNFPYKFWKLHLLQNSIKRNLKSPVSFRKNKDHRKTTGQFESQTHRLYLTYVTLFVHFCNHSCIEYSAEKDLLLDWPVQDHLHNFSPW